jgi:hypothetical protein
MQPIKSSKRPQATPLPPMPELVDWTEEQDVAPACTVDLPPLVPEGTYEVVFVRAEKARIWDARQKVFLHFRIMDQGAYLDRALFMIVTFPTHGRLSLSSKYLREWSLAAGTRPTRRDRLSTQVFRHKVFLARVRTVTKDHLRQERPRHAQYSVIDTLLEVRTGL